jgi:ATP-dependent DNA helicase RecQ
MEFLARSLDDPAAAPCGKCMYCTGRVDRKTLPPELIQEAIDFLRSDHLIIEPRHQWPKSVLSEIAEAWPNAVERFDEGRPKMPIPAGLRAEEGRVLCSYGDAGWGQEVARGKYEAGTFSDALIRAAAALIRNKWKPTPAPEWVTCVPSRRHPELVQGFARRLAAELGIPYRQALTKRRDQKPQKEMQNSPTQVRNLLGGFAVLETSLERDGDGAPASEVLQYFKQKLKAGLGGRIQLPTSPVLLVDDVVDSGWTLTVAAVLLREHGSGPVFPFALARASLRGS